MAKEGGRPQIRFAGFDEVWEQRKLLGCIQKITDFRGRTPKKLGMDWSESGYLALSALNVKDGYIDFSQDVHYGDQALYDKWMSGNELHEGQVLFTTEAPMGNVAQVPDNKRYILSQRTIAFDVKEDIITENFLATLLRSPAVFNTLTSLSSGGTAKGVSQKSLAGVDVQIPTDLNEQALLADYFKQLDHLITLHQRKYDKLTNVKKSMLEKMFPKNGSNVPEIRFKGFTEAWEQRKLGDVCEIKDSARIPNSEWEESGIPYIRASDVTNESTDGVLFISPEKYEFYKKRTGAPAKGDVLFNGGGEIGKSLLIADEKSIYVQGGAVLYARTSESSELVGQYVKTYFETTYAKSYIDAASAGGTMKHFTLKPSQMMPVLMPSVDEQQKIGDYFYNLDHLITLHQRKCDELKNMKKFMLQNMFV